MTDQEYFFRFDTGLAEKLYNAGAPDGAIGRIMFKQGLKVDKQTIRIWRVKTNRPTVNYREHMATKANRWENKNAEVVEQILQLHKKEIGL